jgi:hypothetical protein
MDDDLMELTKEQLLAEIGNLRAAIRAHRDASGHDLCWYHPAMWSLLPEKLSPAVAIPEWPQFMRGCIQYRQSLDRQNPAAPRTSMEVNRDVRDLLKKALDDIKNEARANGLTDADIDAEFEAWRAEGKRVLG